MKEGIACELLEDRIGKQIETHWEYVDFRG